jgi:hypothetical protein
MQHVISNAVSGTVIAKANGLLHCGSSGEESTHGIIFFAARLAYRKNIVCLHMF